MDCRKIFLVLALLFIATVSINAQDVKNKPVNDLDSETLEQISISVRQEVQLFTSYLSSIVKKKNARNSEERETIKRNRELLKKEALNLFVGKGDKYDVVIYDINNNPIDTVHHRPVIMQTMTVHNPIPKDTAMVKYLSYKVYQANRGMITGVSLQISSYDWQQMRVSPPMKIGDGTYVMDVFYVQNFRMINGDNIILPGGDKTVKRVTCYIYVSETDKGKQFIVRLGDIKAEEVERWN